jgi:hypothetical protein
MRPASLLSSVAECSSRYTFELTSQLHCHNWLARCSVCLPRLWNSSWMQIESVDSWLCEIRGLRSSLVDVSRLLMPDVLSLGYWYLLTFRTNITPLSFVVEGSKTEPEDKAPYFFDTFFFFETSGNTNLATRRHIPQDLHSNVLSCSTWVWEIYPCLYRLLHVNVSHRQSILRQKEVKSKTAKEVL